MRSVNKLTKCILWNNSQITNFAKPFIFIHFDFFFHLTINKRLCFFRVFYILVGRDLYVMIKLYSIYITLFYTIFWYTGRASILIKIKGPGKITITLARSFDTCSGESTIPVSPKFNESFL